MLQTVPLARQVAANVRARAVGYVNSPAIRIETASATTIEATVRGKNLYHVGLELEGRSLHVNCTCPYFQDRVETCKHIWAVLMTADQQGSLHSWGNLKGVQLVENADDLENEDWVNEPDAWEPPDLPAPLPRPARTKPNKTRPPKAGDWKKAFASLQPSQPHSPYREQEAQKLANSQVVYIIDREQTLQSGRLGLLLETALQERKKDGAWSKPMARVIDVGLIEGLPDPADRQILCTLLGASQSNSYYGGQGARYRLSRPQCDLLLPQLCRTGRCFLRKDRIDSALLPMSWDEAGPWALRLNITSEGRKYHLKGELVRGEDHAGVTEPLLLIPGYVFWSDRIAPFDDHHAFNWVTLLREKGTLEVPVAERDQLLEELYRVPALPRLDVPAELRVEEIAVKPRPRLLIKKSSGYYGSENRLTAHLSFDYDGLIVDPEKKGPTVYLPEQHRVLRRGMEAESAAAALLLRLGFRQHYSDELELNSKNLPRAVLTLVQQGWHVEAEGKLYKNPGKIDIQVKSGIDWFELHGKIDYEGQSVALPDLLAALKKGENLVKLGDGSFGMLPEEWLKKYAPLAGLGKSENGHLKFRQAQVGLLDALLAAQPEATCDEVFRQARDRLHKFDGVKPTDPPKQFTGELRPYQRDGLGWLHFLRDFHFGGCLADDMGLGKTVQVLGLLEARRQLRAKNNGQMVGPSLVVVPRSLVFNWKEEAKKFTPQLRVLDHTGGDRQKPGDHFDDYDLILTTYGTLRRDALQFKDVEFDYCILDEAQIVKNAKTEQAKAVRLIRAQHRLAMSGTPIENHLGELWSLFDFLNPGMLGQTSAFQLLSGGRTADAESRQLLARALRPFILRRTKAEVAKDLPAKTEQTIFCELEPEQRKLYNEVREHVRQSLLGRAKTEGMGKLKILVLEALLRLRQAACHPGLIDKKRIGDPSAKLDLLLEQVAEVTDKGHKALVFSQFTSLLAIVRDRLDKAQIPYQYLDGKTRDRASKVEAFQNDPNCKVFLISLKAGGLGLNLTAADYVFLLDPWWNPAVEAQAIDRAHRIGQDKQVFAYRLIAKDTVEEKVLELQKTKRDLADAIINADNSLIRNLGREDLELLLS